MTIAHVNYIWTGNDGSTSWTDPKNWLNSATGLVPSTAPGANSADTATIDAGATIWPSLSSTVTIAALTVNAQAKLTVATGGVLNLHLASASAVSNVGTITLSGGHISTTGAGGGIANSGVIMSTTTSAIRVGSGRLANTGQIDVNAGILTVTGKITNSSSINLGGGTLTDSTAIVNSAGATISGLGTLNAAVTNSGTITANSGALTLDQTVTGGALSIGDSVVDTLTIAANSSVNSISFVGSLGTLAIAAGKTLTDATLLNNSGAITLARGSALSATAGLTTTATGSISALGSASISGGFTNNGALHVATGGTLTLSGAVHNNAAITLAGSGSLKSSGALVNAGSIAIATGKLSDTAELTNSGSITLAGGRIADTAGVLNNGTISGYGTFAAPVVANSTGTVEASGGKLTLSSAVHGGHLEIGGGATDDLVVTANSSVEGITFANAAGASTLTVNADVAINDAQQFNIGSNNLLLNGTLSDTVGGLTLAGGHISGGGGVAGGTNITGYGTLAVAITGAETITASGGVLTLSGLVDQSGNATSFDIANGAKLTFSAPSVVGSFSDEPTLTFNGASGTFIDTAATFGTTHLGLISGFSGTDKIELNAYGTNDKFSITGSTLTIHNGSHSETFAFASSVSSQYITVSDVGGVDTIAICFLAGTMIRTPDGERPVETLKRGDLVLTTDGVAKPISWLGKQTVAAAFADPIRSWPIRVKAGALAENTPSRDLLLSPDHALLIEGAMIHAGALVNGVSILRETRVPRSFIYYHVELDDHSLILAENTPAETFIDNCERLAFDNWKEHQQLYPNGKDIEELTYPRAKSARQVPVHIRIFLAERAQLLGLAEFDGKVA